jgi:uncharacterized membrane protein YdjX (TVP38/TMEM64 family)
VLPVAPPGRLAHTWRRIGLSLALLLLLGFALSQAEWRALLLRIIGIAQVAMSDHPTAGALLFLLLSAFSVMAAFFSSAVLVPAAVATYGPWGTFFLLWSGWILGGSTSYAVGRGLGRPIVRRMTSPELLARYESRITATAPWGVVLLLQLALPSELPGYLLGLLRWGYLRYLPALALGELPYAIGTVFLGEQFLAGRTVTLVMSGAGVIVLSVVAYEVLHRRLDGNAPAGGTAA